MNQKMLKERVKLNKEMFSEEEAESVLNNIDLFVKIYLLGIADSHM